MTPRPSLAEITAQLTAPGQLFEMEEADVGGVRTRVWKAAPPSLRTVFDLSLGHGDADFLVYEGERTTFAGHYRAAATLAQRLVGDLAVKKGERVAIAMRNLPEWVIAFWATVIAGAVAVPLNAWWTAEELCFALDDSGAAVIFADGERAGLIRPHLDALPELRAVVLVSEDRVRHRPSSPKEREFEELIGPVSADAAPPEVVLDPDDVATIFYTSGTTGKPKGVVGTHRNASSNLMNVLFARSRSRLRAAVEPEGPMTTDRPCTLLSVPLFHATGCLALLVSTTAAGGKLVMTHHFDPERAVDLIETERVTIFGGVPTVVLEVLASPELARRDTGSVRSVSYGGAPAPPDLVRRVKDAFPAAEPSNAYGLTETSALTTLNSGQDYVEHPDSVGVPVPVADVAVVAAGHSGPEPVDAGPGAVGELWIKGPHVVRGYWRRPDETAAAFSAGWVRTGDLARYDDQGFLYIVDRTKDVVIRGGENVYSVEVESALIEHPAVVECAVVGIPHPVLGEEVAAILVLHPGAKVTADELVAHVRDRRPAYTVPTRMWLRSGPLPRNSGGKVLKRELRDELLAPKIRRRAPR